MHRNKMNSAGTRIDNNTVGRSMLASNLPNKTHAATSTSTGFRQSKIYSNTKATTNTMKSRNVFDDDDDFVEQSSSRKHRKMDSDVNKPSGSKTRPNYTPDPHDKSDFQNTYAFTTKALKKNNISNISRQLHRFSGQSLSNQKHSTPLSAPRRTPGIFTPLSDKLNTQPTDLTNPSRSTDNLALRSNPLKLPICSSTTSGPRRTGISIPLPSTLEPMQQSPSSTMTPRSPSTQRKKSPSLSISRHLPAASAQQRLIVPYRQKPLKTPKTTHEGVPKINKISSDLFLPGKRRTATTIDSNGASSSSSILNNGGFVLPGKRHVYKAINPSFTGVPDDEPATDESKDTVECPYCSTKLDLSQPSPVSKAYAEFKLKEDQYEKQQLKQVDSKNAHGESLDLNHAFDDYNQRRHRRPMSGFEQFSFCNVHIAEYTMKPKGVKNGWPSIISFDTLRDRIAKLQEELDWVIARRTRSTYRRNVMKAYKELGQNKARSSMGMMGRFLTCVPGYYGAKGAAVIQEVLADMYLYSGKLQEHVTAPQTSIEYLQQVLVPEAGFRLIREDLILKDQIMKDDPWIDKKARIVMARSASFGCCLQPLGMNDDDDEEDGRVDECELKWNNALPVDRIQDDDWDALFDVDGWNNDDDCSSDDNSGSLTKYDWINDDDCSTVDEEEDARRQNDSNRVDIRDDTTDDSDDMPPNQPESTVNYSLGSARIGSKDAVILLDDD